MRKYFKIILPVVALILMSVSLLAQEQPGAVRHSTVTEQYKGKSYYIHFVRTGETLTNIAKEYDVSTDAILAANPEAQQNIYVNQVLKIPVNKPAQVIPTIPDTMKQTPTTTPTKTTTENPAQQKAVYFEYIVKKQETLYGIAKKFGVSMDDIIAANPGMKVLENGMTLRILIKPEGQNTNLPLQKTAPASKQAVKAANDNAAVKTSSYEVQQGETLYSIARAHNISVETLMALNPELANGLKTGLIIKVPGTGKTEPGQDKATQRKTTKSGEADVAGKNENYLPCPLLSGQDKVYKVALMLPFDLSQSDSLLATDISRMKHAGAYKPFNFIQIYEGALLALDSLEKTGARVKFYVYDSDSGNDTTKTRKILQKSELKQMDLIIGPVFARSAATAARFAARNGINIVNPLSKRSEIIKGNPSLFKVQPSADAIAQKLAAFIVSRHPDANVLLVRQVRTENPELSKLISQKIKSQLQQAGRKVSAIPVADIVYQSDLFGGVSKRLSTVKENIVIVLSNNAVFIPDFISRLNNLHKSHNIILFGLPEWESLDPETDYLVNLNYHQYSNTWVDYSDLAVREFRKKFQSRFYSEPENEKYAFLGYDMTFFFVKALLDYGHDFGPCLTNPLNNQDAPFIFRKSGSKDGYENMHLNILKIENYRWVDAEKANYTN